MKNKWEKYGELTFSGCIIDPSKPGPHKLTREQTRELAWIIFCEFKRRYLSDLPLDQIDDEVLSKKQSAPPKPDLPHSKKKKAER